MTNTSYLSIWVVLSAYFVVSLLFFPLSTTALHDAEKKEEGVGVPVAVNHGTVVKKNQRWSIETTENGEISAVKMSDGRDGFYHLQFITMEPNSLFLPVHLRSDMVFYVESGSGTLSWIDLEKDDDKLKQVNLRTGDVYRLRIGSFFYLQSSLEFDRRKLRINAILSDSKDEILEGSTSGAYANVRDLILGFDNKVLQAALAADEDMIRELRSGENQPMIVHGVTKGNEVLAVHYRIMRAFLGRMKNDIVIDVNKNEAYNILDAKHDVENNNGWSLVVTSKQFDALKDSNFGVYMVNLTKGAMMGPHWNPMTTEIAVALEGRGMVHVVCPSTLDETECENSRFRVQEGDVFVVPRYHPMAQMSFNNETFVFLGFTTTQKNNHPQYLSGSASIFQALDKNILEISLGVSNSTMEEILSAQREAIILECASCAEEEEEEERLMEEEIQRRKEEEARRKEEEERMKKDEEIRKWEEDEAKKEQEKSRKKEEEEAKEQEEEAARQKEEQEAKKQEEEAAKQREEEARMKQQKEEAARRQQEEEARQQEAEARQQREQQKQEEDRRRRQEEETARQHEEEAVRRWQDEEEDARQREGEARRRKQEQQEEEDASQHREEREKKAARQREEDARQQEEVTRQTEEEAAIQQEEEAARRQQEEEAARIQEDAARRRKQQGEVRHGGRGRRGGEGEASSREEEEMDQRRREAEVGSHPEEAARQKEEAARSQRQEDVDRRQQQQGDAQHDGAGGRGRKGGGGEAEASSKEEEEMDRRQREAEAAARGGRGGGSLE